MKKNTFEIERAAATVVALIVLVFGPAAAAQDQDPSAALRRIPLDVETVRRRNAETLRLLSASERGYTIVIGAAAGPVEPERAVLESIDEEKIAPLLDRARTLMASPEARLRNLVVEIRKEFFRGAEESSERHRLWAELLLETPSGRRLGINGLAESIVHDSRNARAWAALGRELPKEGKRLVERRVDVRAELRREGDGASILLDPRASSRAATSGWLAYARTRALWSGEGRFAERFGHETPYRVTGAEVIDAVERLVETYEIERSREGGAADADLEWLVSLRREGLLRAFVHVDWAPGPLADARRGGVAPDPESVREYLGRYRVDPPSRSR